VAVDRKIKDILFEQVARIGKAYSSPKRLELNELLCQGPKTVEELAHETSMSHKLTSAHLRELRISHLVQTERSGKNIYYRLANKKVAYTWVKIHSIAEEHLTELQSVMHQICPNPNDLVALDHEGLMLAARKGSLVLLDVRSVDEYLVKHLPFARSIPFDELQQRFSELPKDRPIVAYSRGPYCLTAKNAVAFLKQKGHAVSLLRDGIAEWSFVHREKFH